MKRKRYPLMTGLALGTGLLGLGLVKRIRRLQAEGLVWQKQRRQALEVFACPECGGALTVVSLQVEGGYLCPACQKVYPIVDGIPHFIETQVLTGLNKRFSQMYDWFSWGYRLFSRVAFAHLGMPEETARREITDRLDPHGGKVLEVSIGPGVNLPYLVKRPDVGEVFGLDISLGQLTHCQRYMRRHGWDVDLFLGNAEQLPFGDSIFDGVFHIGGINFFNNKKAAIDEMIRVARPGARLLIADENEKGAKGYDKFIPGFKKSFGGRRNQIVAPIDHVPGTMLELRFFNIWKGLFYCLEFRKP